MKNISFSVVIPTYNRPEDLERCIRSIAIQNRIPDTVIVVDDGVLSDLLIERLKEILKGVPNFIYRKKKYSTEPRGTSLSRNIGINLTKEDIFFILDDDLVLNPDFFEIIMGSWEKHFFDTKILAIGGVITNNRSKTFSERLYNKIFAISSKGQWDVNEVAYQVWNDKIKEEEEYGFYAHGGVSSYRTEGAKKNGGFNILSDGRTALEDVDFFLASKNLGYKVIIEPSAKVFHAHGSGGREGAFETGFKESKHRKIIFHKRCKQDFLHRIWFVWSSFGWVLRQLLSGHWLRAFGMFYGFIKF